MAIPSKTVCQWLIGIMGGALLFSFFCSLTPIAAYRLSEIGAKVYLFTALVSVPVSVILLVREFRRPQRALHWPFILLAVSALLPLMLAGVSGTILWTSPD
jgi:hypothetical protein